MAIQEQPLIGQGCTPYVPGTTNFSATDNMCVEAGDRVIVTAVTFQTPGGGNNITVDGTTNPGPLGPTFAYKPAYSRKEDPYALTAQFYHPSGSVGGNDGSTPTIRVDLQTLYCRWAGTVTIEGGDGPGPGPGTVLISFLWDRASRATHGWGTSFVSIITFAILWICHWLRNPLMAAGRAYQGDDHFPRVPVSSQGFVRHTLTFYLPGNDLGPGPVLQRPVAASYVWTPDGSNVILQAGAAGTPFTVSGDLSNPVPLSYYTTVKPTVKGQTIIFGIDI